MKKVLIAGGTGLVGKRLIPHLQQMGHTVGVLTRKPNENIKLKYHYWNLSTAEIDRGILEYDILINLAGTGIADKRWSRKRKREIINSRVEGNKLLLRILKAAGKKFDSVISASAIGIYGNSEEQFINESHIAQFEDFLVKVCRKWEASAKLLADQTQNQYILRIGTVLSKDGGALPKLTMPMKLGLASYFGSGNQWMSWIHIDDLCKIILFLLDKNDHSSIINAVSPEPVRNKELTNAFRRHINTRALLLPFPETAVRVLFGEMGSLLLNSNKVSCAKLEAMGFVYKYPSLDSAISHLLLPNTHFQ